jgi:hypothetical protein
MADVIDFMCDNGLTFYIMDATSPLIEWNYKGYHIDSSLISISGISTDVTGGGTSVRISNTNIKTFIDKGDDSIKGVSFLTNYSFK